MTGSIIQQEKQTVRATCTTTLMRFVQLLPWEQRRGCSIRNVFAKRRFPSENQCHSPNPKMPRFDEYYVQEAGTSSSDEHSHYKVQL